MCCFLFNKLLEQQQVPANLKIQVFANLTDYLSEEDRRTTVRSHELAKNLCKDDLREMLDVQSGMASTIIQAYLQPILRSYLTSNTTLRVSVFNCLSHILNQGLVYPIECVPYLIAMTTDVERKIETKALAHLTALHKAHSGLVQSKSIAGVHVSFMLHRNINSLTTSSSATVAAAAAAPSTVLRGFSEQAESGDVLSLNHHLYSLLRVNRSHRRAFLQQLLKMFDCGETSGSSSSSASSAAPSSASNLLAQMLFITDNLAYFPYQVMDEPLYLIHHIDIIVSVIGINLLHTFKEVCRSKSRNNKTISHFSF